ncbi:MAG: hypothetical protein K6U80_03975 [Firmicutes bacterium]|nr:hypothetical protein [Bacillota bacterium]
MQIRFAFLCDYAQESGNGKISALGIGIDSFHIVDLRQPAPSFCLVVNIEANRSEAGQKHMEIHLMDSDGKSVTEPLHGEISLQGPPSGMKIKAGIVIYYNGIIFPNYGPYLLSIVIDGHEMTSLPIYVAQAQPLNPQ